VSCSAFANSSDGKKEARKKRERAALAGCAVALTAAVLAACATPAERYERRATTLGFSSLSLQGEGFRHVAYAAGLGQSSDTLHVYIEHDGTPWIALSRVASDPTPRTPFALELMANDSGPRLLLGRPCYFESKEEASCNPLLWTHRRYAPEVITSMDAALRSFLSSHPFRHVVLIGYSGGGTIAWLMAAHVAHASAVITVVANLDTEEWTKIHGFSPLEGSLNPALQPELPSTIAQRHYAGGRDENVPPAVVRSFAARHRNAAVIEIASFDHTCCWIEQWRRLLDESEVK
jgi:hypothetical protein